MNDKRGRRRGGILGGNTLGSLRVFALVALVLIRHNGARPHRGPELKTPNPRPDARADSSDCVRVRRRDVLGGLIHAYERAP
jgi:hypothetical protein